MEKLNYVVFGAGVNARYVIMNIKKRFSSNRIYLVDNYNFDFQYEAFGECYPVYHTSKLLEESPERVCIIISSLKNHTTMANQLRSMGFVEGKHFFGGPLFIQCHWMDIGNLHPAMHLRVKMMSELISVDSKSVLDVGCGDMFLKQCLRDDIKYIPCDYVARNDATIVCDLNQKQYPDVQVDTVFLSGILEHVEDYTTFLGRMCACAGKEVIISYNVVEYRPIHEERCRSGILNYLSSYEIKEIFRQHQMYIQESKIFECPSQLLFKFVRM